MPKVSALVNRLLGELDGGQVKEGRGLTPSKL
jgi:hypothetical protein